MKISNRPTKQIYLSIYFYFYLPANLFRCFGQSRSYSQRNHVVHRNHTNTKYALPRTDSPDVLPASQSNSLREDSNPIAIQVGGISRTDPISAEGLGFFQENKFSTTRMRVRNGASLFPTNTKCAMFNLYQLGHIVCNTVHLCGILFFIH